MLISLVGAVVLQILPPVYYKDFFNLLSGVSGPASDEVVGQLIRIIFIILGMNVGSWIFFRIATLGNNYFQPAVMRDLANSCFKKLHSHSYNFFTNRFVGSLVRRVNRLVSAFERISDRLYWDLLPLIVRLIIILCILFYNNTTIGAILLIWIVIYLTLNYAFSLYKLKYDVVRAESDSKVTARLADTITNNLNIKIFTSFPGEFRVFRQLTQEQFKITKFTWNLAETANLIQMAFMIALEFLIFYYAIRYWRQGLLTIGDFVLVQAYLLQLFHQLWGFGRIIRDVYERLADAEEMVEIIHTPYEVQDKHGAKRLRVSKGVVEFDRVQFGYSASRSIINDLTLTIGSGEKIGLVGPSGAGKSTITSLLLRFVDISSGTIKIDGQNIADVTQQSLRQQISYVPQDPILFHRTLRENIQYGRPDATEREVMEASKLAHCDEFVDMLSERYETYVGERGIKLSGGERQRIAIARAILKNAPILVLDEATSSLDSHSELMIQDALNRLMEGKTVLVIAHRLSTIMKMDRIVILEHGHIREVGTHVELLNKQGGLYNKLWHLQAGGFIHE